MTKPVVLINALHTHVGGGVTYLAGVLPHLVAEERLGWQLLVTADTRAKLEIPHQVEVREVPVMGTLQSHLYEQFVLPFVCRAWGVKAVLCNANFVPLLAPKPMPVVHTTLRAAAEWKGLGMRVYWWALRWLTAASILRAPVAFAVAAHVAKDYVRAPWLRRKVRVVHPAVAESRAKVRRDPNLIVAVGDFYAQKDYPTLVNAFALLRENRPASRLLIVGRPVFANVRDEVLDLVRKLGVADAVTMTGAVPRKVLMETMAKAAVYVSTSRAESVQLPLLEAMVMGTPVVAAKAPHTEEFVGDAGVLIPVEKGGDVAAAFAVALFGVLETKSIGEMLQRRGLARMEGKTWQATAKIFTDELMRVL